MHADSPPKETQATKSQNKKRLQFKYGVWRKNNFKQFGVWEVQ